MAGKEPSVQVEGTHRMTYPRWYLILWFVFVGASSLNAVVERRWLSIPVAIAIAGVVLLTTRLWGPATQICPEGVRTRQGWRKKECAWDHVRSVESPGRWEMARDVRIRLEDGSSVPLPGLPADQWAEPVECYWRAHRGDAANHSDAPEDGDR